MKIHNVRVSDRALYIDPPHTLVQGTYNEDKVNLVLDKEWDGLDIKITFADGYGNNVMPIKQSDNTYFIPWEVMQKPGKVAVAVLGYKGDSTDPKANENGAILKHAIGDTFKVIESSTDCIGRMTSRTSEDLAAMRGYSAYEVAQLNGYKGTQEEWLASLKGDKGDRGYSAYELAQQAGFTGTEAEWRVSLKGDRGYSAYELAQQAGFTGTIDEWRASLKGDKGDKGDTGAQGYGAVASVSRTNFTEADWNNYGTVDHIENWPNSDSIRNGCRIGDLFLVVGTATDTGNGHTLIYRSDTASGNLYGSCIGHVIANKGETGNKGDKGDRGYSAYDIAVKDGYKGSEADWLVSLKTGMGWAKGWTSGTNGTSVLLPTKRTDISDMIIIYYATNGTTTFPFAYTYLPMPVFSITATDNSSIPASLLNPDVATKNTNITTTVTTDGIQVAVANGSSVTDGNVNYTVTMNTYYKLMNDGTSK